MKKIFFLLSILAVFGLFCLVGFQIAAHSDSQSMLPTAHQSTGSIGARQNNLLLIQVDQLGAQKNTLRAVWLVIRFHSENQTVLNFTPIYPTSNPASNTEIEGVFSLNSKSEPSPDFLRSLSVHKIEQNGYIVIDDTGLAQLTTWLDPQHPQTGLADPAGLLRLGCTFFAAPQNKQAPPFDWGAFSSHVSSNIGFNDILAEWSLLVTAQPPTRCDLPPQ